MSSGPHTESPAQSHGRARSDRENLCQQLLEAAPDAFVVMDQTGRIVLVNEQAEKMFGYARQDLLGRTIEVLVPDRFRTQHVQQRNSYLAHPKMRRMGSRPELQCRRQDGSEFASEICLNPIETDEGTWVVAAVRDLTERKEIERALQESEERFELAVKGSNAGIWDWDLRTDEVYFSTRWKNILGYEEHEIAPAFGEWEVRLHPDDRERATQTIQDYLSGRTTSYEFEHRLQHKDGSYRWILARGAAVRDVHGQPYRMVGSHIDITEHKRTEERLRENVLQLLAAQRIQQHLLPRSFPNLPGLEIAAVSRPTTYAGGDLYDFVPMLEGRLGFLVGDVSGHGFASALVMASTQAFLRCLAQSCATVGEIVTRANHFICAETGPEQFVTLLLARYDPTTRAFTYINAGHPTGYLIGPEGEVKEELISTEMPLGFVDDLEFAVSGTIRPGPGDLIYLLTDGIIEEESSTGEQFGTERSLEAVRAARHQSAHDVLESLLAAIRNFTGGEPPRDDLTAMAIKILPGD